MLIISGLGLTVANSVRRPKQLDMIQGNYECSDKTLNANTHDLNLALWIVNLLDSNSIDGRSQVVLQGP